MTPPAASALVNFKGLPCVLLQRPAGDRALIALHGAQVLSWVSADGREHLYLSPKAQLDGQAPIRGGIPLCFPQFNQRIIEARALPKHGFARQLAWLPLAAADDQARDAMAGGRPEGASAASPQDAAFSEQVLALSPAQLTPALRQAWPFAFEARLTVRLGARSLGLRFELHNTGDQPLPFALALHSYLRVDDIAQVQLEGLQGAAFWDAVAHPNDRQQIGHQDSAALRIQGEVDRVYRSRDGHTRLMQGDHQLDLAQSQGFTETVVWNPGAALCAGLADMPPEGYRHMLCIEAACIDAPVWLAPGAHWQASQTFHCP